MPFLVGLAIIGGLLAWLNRRGGCASRRNNKRTNNDFEDFGLAETDFPHHRASPAMAAAALGGGAAAGAAAASSNKSPTVPRMAESNAPSAAYYNAGVPPPSDYDSGRHYAPYQPQLDEYAMQQQHAPQQQGGYYYPQEQGQQGYYDEQYYYDNQQPMPAGGEYNHYQQQQQQPFSPNDHYKPDQVEKPNERF
jgi:hypothetical protein